MPYRKPKQITGRKAKTTRRNAKVVRRTRKRYTKTNALRTKWYNPIRQGENVKFVYTDSRFSVTLAAGTSYYAYYVFRGNSGYDPDYTGVGVQPYGWDQLIGSGLYTLFRITASSIKVFFRPESAVRRLHAVVFPFRVANPTVSDISDVRMIPDHKETTYDSEQESTRGARLTHYTTTQHMYHEMTAKDGSLAAFNTNPSSVWFWIVYFYVDEFTNEELDVFFDVRIKYYTKLARTEVPNES